MPNQTVWRRQHKPEHQFWNGALRADAPLLEFFAPHLEAFRQGLRELGYVEGQNLVIEYRYAEGSEERLRDLAAELVRLQVDVIVVGGAPSA